MNERTILKLEIIVDGRGEFEFVLDYADDDRDRALLALIGLTDAMCEHRVVGSITRKKPG